MFFFFQGGLNKSSTGETKIERWIDGWRGDVRKEMFDREGEIERDSRGHGLKESDRHRKKETDGGCLEGGVFF